MSLSFLLRRTVVSDVVQGIILGGVLAFATVLVVLPIRYVSAVHRWVTVYGCGEPGDSIFLRAACGVVFMGPINVPEEAVYWTTKTDGSGKTLSGAHDYVMHFPPGGLPQDSAFWSLTMGDAKNRFVANPLDRYSLSNRSDLVQNADGSTDIYIQNAEPVGHESNWLPTPTGNFILWLRVYLPGEAILNGTYAVPAVVVTSGPPAVEAVTYTNAEYGFSVALPQDWKGYTVLNQTWTGYAICATGQCPTESGPQIAIRNPRWTAGTPYQDIPVMVFTIDEWHAVVQGTLGVSAAPIPPRELGRNATYVFALPARYDYAFPAGWQEVQDIVNAHPLHAF